MTQWPPPDPYVEAKLLGILLSGVFVQTRPECGAESRLSLKRGASPHGRRSERDQTGALRGDANPPRRDEPTPALAAGSSGTYRIVTLDASREPER
jgi:hypothetical protein